MTMVLWSAGLDTCSTCSDLGLYGRPVRHCAQSMRRWQPHWLFVWSSDTQTMLFPLTNGCFSSTSQLQTCTTGRRFQNSPPVFYFSFRQLGPVNSIYIRRSWCLSHLRLEQSGSVQAHGFLIPHNTVFFLCAPVIETSLWFTQSWRGINNSLWLRWGSENIDRFWLVIPSNLTRSSTWAVEVIKRAQQWLLILLVNIQFWHSSASIKVCFVTVDVWRRRWLCRVASVPGAKSADRHFWCFLSVKLSVPVSHLQSVNAV